MILKKLLFYLIVFTAFPAFAQDVLWEKSLGGKQAEFLYDCVNDTIERIIPEEVDYLVKYDEFKTFLDNNLEMPDDMVALLVRFLEQGNGTLSKRAKEKEFEALTAEEINTIEEQYKLIFLS